jgi:hypothetical protein
MVMRPDRTEFPQQAGWAVHELLPRPMVVRGEQLKPTLTLGSAIIMPAGPRMPVTAEEEAF